MRDKINDSKLRKILMDYVVSWQTLLLISIILFAGDYFLSSPLYIMVLDMGPVAGSVLALGMATLFTVLPKVAAKLFAKTQYGLGLIAIVCGIGLLSFIFIGQAEVAKQKENLSAVMTGGAESEMESSIHIIATSLLGLLFTCAVFLSYLYYRDNLEFKPMNIRLSMSKLARLFQFKLLPLKGRSQRANDKPQIIAEERVNEFIRDLEQKQRKLQAELAAKEAERNYECNVLANTRTRIKQVIQAAYKS